MRMRKSASSVVAIGALLAATVLWGSMPGVALSQSEEPSTAASSLEPFPTTPPLPTEAVPVPCGTTTPVPTEAAPTEAAPSFSESSAAPVATEAVPVEASVVPCESAAPSESPAASEAPVGSEIASAFCALLTTEEIQSVIGSPVIPGSGDETSCGWASADPNSATLIVVQDLALSDFDQLKSMSLPGMTNHPRQGWRRRLRPDAQ